MIMKLTKSLLCAALLVGVSSAAMADYSGFYIGPQVSYNWMGTSWKGENGITSTNFRPDGFSVGPHVGWAYQMNAWVLGLEGSYSGGSYTSQENSYKTVVSQMYTATPLIGYTQDNWLLYGKAGYASGNVEADIYSNTANTWKANERQYGWTAGLGVAYQLDQKNSIGLEYDYSRLGGTNFNSTSNGVTHAVDVNPIHINTVTFNYTRYFW